ncbi:deoxyhypusine hydroxylase [Plasmodium reichenowi]|uniref:Deoxyhypusine hydroxylase n=2 Tax=Plasmodium reichenowi TaxID=5854 RepID=A0A060RWR5_PLARE|nr:deoxyhypusine hydroxylase [Plasmodium reichenowi]
MGENKDNIKIINNVNNNYNINSDSVGGDSSNKVRLIKYEESTNKEFILKYLVNIKNDYIEKQMRALYECREVYKDDIDEVINILTYALKNNDSILLRHEIAYVIGQISNEKCNNILINLLSDENENIMVRHEAAEGLAAIGSESNIPIIKKYLNDSNVEVRETCELALSSLIEKNKYAACSCINKTVPYKNNLLNNDKPKSNSHSHSNSFSNSQDDAHDDIYFHSKKKFNTIDPVVCISDSNNKKHVNDLIRDLNNEALALKNRYEALFLLRDMETDISLNALGEALINDKSSAIFRHELAFVLGQVLHLNSLKYLLSSLTNVSEHEMVRHEVALALGSLGSLNLNSDEYKIIQEQIIDTLKKYSKDECVVVAESCLVGLDYISENLNISIEVH